jgi:hypothetical protein
LNEDHPLFDRKFLEELHEQGVGNDRELTSVSGVGGALYREPQKQGFLPPGGAIYPAKKGGCCKPAKLTGFILIKTRIFKK